MARFIELFRPALRFFPTIKKPERKVSFKEKLFWSGLALIIYLFMGAIPIYGIPRTPGQVDPFGALRVIFASTRGSLVELGIGPIVTAGLILQVLAGSKMINVDFKDPGDRSLFTGASKVLAIFMTVFEGLAFIVGGAYGTGLAFTNQFYIILQLVAAGVIIILLDEMLQKGWGIGSGISLFIIGGVAQEIWWNTIGPNVDPPPQGDGLLHGAVFYMFQAISRGVSVFSLSGNSVIFRGGLLPDILGLIGTIGIFLLMILLTGVRVEIPVSYAKYKGYRGKFPIKLLYATNIPVIFAAALFGNIYFIGQLMWSRYNPTCSSFWLNLIPGCFTQVTDPGQRPIPATGLVYYTFAPRSLQTVAADPIQTGVYAALFILGCLFFASTWTQVGGMDARTVAKQLLDSGMHIEGFRRSSLPIRSILQRYISTVTLLGGAIVGGVAVGGDLLGSFGTGTGILLSVGILEQYYQLLVRERVTELYPAARGLLGE